VKPFWKPPSRLRPILMTSIATIARSYFLPHLPGTGSGEPHSDGHRRHRRSVGFNIAHAFRRPCAYEILSPLERTKSPVSES